eukprot:2157841-Prymnesium_polylepis.1
MQSTGGGSYSFASLRSGGAKASARQRQLRRRSGAGRSARQRKLRARVGGGAKASASFELVSAAAHR